MRARCESTTPLRYKHVTTTPKKTCLKDLSRATSRRSWTTEVTDGTHVTAGQLALAVTDLAVRQPPATTLLPSSLWTTESPSWPQSWTAARWRRQLRLWPRRRPWPPRNGSSIAALQTTSLSNKAEQSGFEVLEGVADIKSTPRGPEAVQLQHHGGHERLHRLGQQRHAGHGGRQLRPQDGGGPDIAARITPLEVVANAWGPSPPRRWPRARKPRRLHLGAAGLQGRRQRPDCLRPAVGRGHFLGGGL